MSIETPKQSSENTLNQEPASPKELRDLFHGEAPEVTAEDYYNNSDSTPNTAPNTNKIAERKPTLTEKYLNTRPKQVGAVVLAAAVFAGGPTVAVNVIANNANHGVDHNTDPIQSSGPEVTTQPTPSATSLAEVTPSASPSNITPLETVKPTATHELSADQTEKELATNIVGTFSDWNSAGATVETHLSRDTSLSIKEYAASIAAKNTSTYASKLFGADYASRMQSDPVLKKFIEDMEARNAENIVAFLRTDNTGVAPQDQNPNNIEAWKQETTFEDVASYTVLNGYHQLVIDCIQTDNRNMNLYGGTPGGSEEQKLTVTYTKDGKDVTLTAAKFTKR